VSIICFGSVDGAGVYVHTMLLHNTNTGAIVCNTRQHAVNYVLSTADYQLPTIN